MSLVLDQLVEAYAAGDANAFASLYTVDMEHVDTNRRRAVKGRDHWRTFSADVFGTHHWQRLTHRRRAFGDGWAAVEAEWSGKVFGTVISPTAEDREYDYSGTIIYEFSGNKIARQTLYIDLPRFMELFGDAARRERPRP